MQFIKLFFRLKPRIPYLWILIIFSIFFCNLEETYAIQKKSYQKQSNTQIVENSLLLVDAKRTKSYKLYPVSQFETDYLNLPENEIDIAKAALIVAKGFYPGLDVQKYIDQVNTMAKELKVELRGVKKPEKIIKRINFYFFVKRWLKYKKDNWFLNNVFDHKMGNCSSFTYLYLSVMKRLRLPFYAVAAPNHVFVRYDHKGVKINVETTLNGKQISDKEYIKQYNIPLRSIKQGIYMRNKTKKQLIADMLRNRGTSFVRTGKLEMAIKDYNKAISFNPMYSEAYFNRGIAYAKKGNFQKAIKDYNKASLLNYTWVKPYMNRALVYHEIKDYDKAIKDYDKVISLNPKDYKAYYLNGVCYFAKGNVAEALHYLDKAISFNPKDAKPYYMRGMIFAVRNDKNKMLKDLNKVIQLDPSLKNRLRRDSTFKRWWNDQEFKNIFHSHASR